MTTIPLGISEEYELLPRVSPLRRVLCQDCLRYFEDGNRLLENGTKVLAAFCPEDRARRREE